MNPQTVNIEAPPPLRIQIAGAAMDVTPGRLAGTFHPIPLPLWQAIIGFHRQVSINHLAESVSYHHWHAGERRYHTIIPWQRSTGQGLSVSLDWTSKPNAELLDAYAALYKEDFFPACTIHTHVDTMAFESGTDARDEAENPGWHITLGKLVSAAKYDLDFRMRIPLQRKITALIDNSRGHKLKWENLFTSETTWADVHQSPGTLDWHHLLERVSITS